MSTTALLTDSVVAAAQRRDQEAIVTVYRALADPVYAYLLRNTRDPAWAADLTGDVFVEVLGSLDRFSGGADGFRAWVFRIARNTMFDHFRKQSRRRHDQLEEAVEAGRLPPSEDVVEDRALGRIERTRVLAMVDQLSPDQREVVLLRLVAGLPVNEVAEIIGKTPGAVKALQHRALRSLADRMGRSREIDDA